MDSFRPLVRFAGFEGEWEKVRLSDVAIINPQCSIPDSFEYVDLESVVGTVLYNHRRENKATAPSRAQRLARKGDIFYQTVRPYQRNNYLFELYESDYVFSTGYAQIRSNINPRFLFVVVQSDSFLKQVMDNCTGTSFPAINSTSLKSLIVCNCDSKEQQKISEYFTEIDRAISLQTQKLSKLKQIKAASLQNMFPQEGQMLPKVRFAGFEGEWEKVKLGEISSKVTQKNSDNAVKVTLTNSAEYGVINQQEFFDHEVAKSNSINGYYVVEPDDFVYNPRISTSAPVGPINMNKLGYAGVVSPLYYVFRVSEIDRTFLDIFFKTNLWHGFMFDNGNSGARFDRLSINDEVFRMMPICCPSLPEQQAIANYFTKLDRKIDLETQKLAKLKQIKSACLSKMFV